MNDPGQLSMMELFRLELQTHSHGLTQGLLALERDAASADSLQACMRAAHSLKGAARIVGLGSGAAIAHAMEELLVAAPQRQAPLGQGEIDQLLRGVDLLTQLGRLPESELARWADEEHVEAQAYQQALHACRVGGAERPQAMPPAVPTAAADPRLLRMDATTVQRLLGLAGESLVESRGMQPLGAGLLRLRRQQQALGRRFEGLRQDPTLGPQARAQVDELRRELGRCQQQLTERLAELDSLERRAGDLAHRLYDEALACRMRPFGEGVQGLPRVVRDLARSLGKRARLELLGESTAVDRELLERLEAPLLHLLRNAVDHGLESPEARRSAGKPEEGVVRLQAAHSGGLLEITVSDDGAGIDLERLRQAVLSRGLAGTQAVASLSESELLDFLLLPGFSLREQVTEISGRGVGLDVVHELIKQVRGRVRIRSEAGRGSALSLHLPLSLSVLRALLVQAGGGVYAFALHRIWRTLRVPRQAVESIEGRPHVRLEGGGSVALLELAALLGDTAAPGAAWLTVVVIGEPPQALGLVVEQTLGERELVVQALDERLGKVAHVSAGALMDDGAIALILDVDDLLGSAQRLAAAAPLETTAAVESAAARKAVLVVDDSLAVRELERKLLDAQGYRVEVAVDGMDGWNALRGGGFDLVVTDVDMPRLDGIELVGLIRADPRLKSLPVMIVSYKDREADRRRGLEAGADRYLLKSAFHSQALLEGVQELIGPP